MGLERVSLRPVCSVWVLDFMWKRFCNPSTGDMESIFIEAGDSETKEEALGVEEVPGENLGSALLWFPRNAIGKK